MTEQERIIYEQDKLIAKLQADLEIKNKQLDALVAIWHDRDSPCVDLMHDQDCSSFRNCRDCVRHYLNYVSKQ